MLDSAPLPDGTVYRLRWGTQVATRTITGTAEKQSRSLRVTHPRQVAAYLAKYLTKATEDFGLPQRVMSAAHAASTGATVHAIRLIEAAEYLAEHGGEAYSRLLAHLALPSSSKVKTPTYDVGRGLTIEQVRRLLEDGSGDRLRALYVFAVYLACAVLKCSAFDGWTSI